jgi:hypothetical protein
VKLNPKLKLKMELRLELKLELKLERKLEQELMLEMRLKPKLKMRLNPKLKLKLKVEPKPKLKLQDHVLSECDGLLSEVWINTVQHSEELICNIFRRPKGKEGIAIQFRGMLDSINPYLG